MSAVAIGEKTPAPSTYRASELALRAEPTVGHLEQPTTELSRQVHESTAGTYLTHTAPVSHAGAPPHALLP